MTYKVSPSCERSGEINPERHFPAGASVKRTLAPTTAQPCTYNGALRAAGIAPEEVRLVRHQGAYGRDTLHQLWLRDRAAFEVYQRRQSVKNRRSLASRKYWASFVAAPQAETLFIGLYAQRHVGMGADEPGEPQHDIYELTFCPELSAYAGKLLVAWGEGYRSWLLRADERDKPILELRRTVSEPPFPGHLKFVTRLSMLEGMPESWKSALSSVGGIYLLTCSRTRAHYVGKADGVGGFLSRWRAYLANGHGGNQELRRRRPSDYQVAILHVAGSSDNLDEIEALWKAKLLSRELGLNKN
jgi:hypothetical protein